jgi:protein involved in polysaccharide export with SLBB domain
MKQTFKKFSSHYFILSIGILCINLQSQDLDKTFLESLPEDLADQIQLRTIEGQSSGGKDLNQVFKADTQIDYDRKTLQELYKKLDDLTNRINITDSPNTLQRFGDNFFASMQASFMPINIPNFGDDYILDVGDKLSIQLIGKQDISNVHQIERDGAINLDQIGKIILAGLSLNQAQKIISSQARSKLFVTETFITLSEVRDIQVMMIGNIRMPGMYTLSGGSSILHAINVAGGIGKNGSFRKIHIIRDNEVLEEVDLYQALIFGKNLFNKTLRSGDTIRVFPQQFLVPISGGVSTPGIYEIATGETLEDLLGFSGGTSANSQFTSAVYIRRISDNKESISNVDIQNADSIVLKPRDSIISPFVNDEIFKTKSVKITGEVKRPGEYSISNSERLLDVIERAGGYNDQAYIFGGALFRSSVKDLQIEFNKRIYSDTINEIISNIAGIGSSASGDTGLLLEEFRSQSEDLKGRMIVDFDISSLQNNRNLNMSLQDGDEIYIPKVPYHIYLFGDFREPSILPYDPSMSIEDYIKLAAGKRPSSARHFIVIDPNGVSHYVSSNTLFSFHKNIDIYPGSIIYMPRQIGKIQGLQYATAISPVLSSLAISLASLNSITND